MPHSFCSHRPRLHLFPALFAQIPHCLHEPALSIWHSPAFHANDVPFPQTLTRLGGYSKNPKKQLTRRRLKLPDVDFSLHFLIDFDDVAVCLDFYYVFDVHALSIWSVEYILVFFHSLDFDGLDLNVDAYVRGF